MLALAVMGLMFAGWLIWAALMLFLGTKHPPVDNPELPLDPKRRAIGWASLVVFILTFTPVPIFFAAPK